LRKDFPSYIYNSHIRSKRMHLSYKYKFISTFKEDNWKLLYILYLNEITCKETQTVKTNDTKNLNYIRENKKFKVSPFLEKNLKYIYLEIFLFK
jgi:hypothetical protein